MKRTISLLLTLAIIATFATVTTFASADDAVEPEIVLKYADLYSEGNPIYEMAVAFSEKVLEKSNGRIRIDIYGGGQLGDDKSSYQALQMGAIDFFRGNAATMSDFGVEKINILASPYVFTSREHLWDYIESDLAQEVLDEPEKLGIGMVGIFIMEEGARSFFFNKPVSKFSDIPGLKIRVPQTQILTDTVNSLGAAATPISYSELYTSLGSGVIDGAENPPTAYLSEHFYEVAPYYILDEHTFNPIIVLASQFTWDKLSEKDRAIIREAGAEVSEMCKEVAQKNDEAALEELASYGVTIYKLDDKSEFQEATKPVVSQYANTEELQAYVEAIAALDK